MAALNGGRHFAFREGDERMDDEPFVFLNPGRLVDDELELVPPHPRWVHEMLAACHDPLTVRLAPAMAATTREQVMAFLKTCPGGRQKALPLHGWWPTYHFWMRLHNKGFWHRTGRASEIPYEIAGGIGLRIGRSKDLECYTGHIGYHVYPAARGHHYAERSCRLLLPLARRHGFEALWITCNPDNTASRITCERLGAELVEVVELPADHPLYRQGERLKCRYRLQL